MKGFTFEQQRFEVNDINFITVNERGSIVRPCIYFISIFGKHKDFESSQYSFVKTKILNQIKQFKDFFKQHGINNFAFLDDCEYIINIDNVQSFEHLENLIGTQLVQVTFKNGQSFDLYKGGNSEYAQGLYKSYMQQQKKYNSNDYPIIGD
ncbi:MAG: hypothetical protein J6A28_02975 [Clostridia bacterium]|nr:hypothetical protein [Clostridia bacterium]